MSRTELARLRQSRSRPHYCPAALRAVGASAICPRISPPGKVASWICLSVVVGVFLFGLGMQLGGGCASGTLYTAGGGVHRRIRDCPRSYAVVETTPAIKPISLVTRFGPFVALVISLSLFGIVTAVTAVVERHRHGRLVADVPPLGPAWGRALQGPWPLVAGAIGLAAVNVATLALAGRPWGVTSAFGLWGSKALAWMGAGVASWPYWTPAARAAELHASVFRDITSVMDFGIMLGALAAAGLAGRFAPIWRVPARSLAAAIVGGLLLGYGARIAYGCNIGAFFSGVSSGSLHGWVWFVAAFSGSILGTHLRPLFGMRVERGRRA